MRPIAEDGKKIAIIGGGGNARRRFLMVGQWVMPGGGLPSGPMTARQVIQRVCRSEGIAFRPGQPARS